MDKKLRILVVGFENCAPDKKPIDFIYDQHRIHFITKGYGYFNGEKIGAGKGFICQINEPCVYYPDAGDPWSYYWVNAVGMEADILIDSIISEQGTVFRWNIETEERVFQELLDFCREDCSDYNRLNQISLFYKLMAFRFSKQKDISRPFQYVQAAKQYFELYYSGGAKVSDAAEQLNLSRAYLRNIFFTELGMSPQKFLMELRMMRALELLEGDFSIQKIAASVGYSDALQFSRIFKKHFGISPTQKRLKMKKLQTV